MIYYKYIHIIFETHALVFLVAQTCSKPAPNLHHSDSLEPQIFHLELQISGIDAFIHLHFNITHHVMMAQEEVELHQHHVMAHGSHWSFWSFWCSDVSGFHVFHVALKYQYFTLQPCTFALATLKTPGGGGSNPAVANHGGLTMRSTTKGGACKGACTCGGCAWQWWKWGRRKKGWCFWGFWCSESSSSAFPPKKECKAKANAWLVEATILVFLALSERTRDPLVLVSSGRQSG